MPCKLTWTSMHLATRRCMALSAMSLHSHYSLHDDIHLLLVAGVVRRFNSGVGLSPYHLPALWPIHIPIARCVRIPGQVSEGEAFDRDAVSRRVAGTEAGVEDEHRRAIVDVALTPRHRDSVLRGRAPH